MGMSMTAIASTVVSIGAMIGMTYTGGTWIENHYAHKEDVILIELRLDQKIQLDRIQQVQQRLWQIEDRYREALQQPEHHAVFEEYRKLKVELEELKDAQNEMDRKINEKRYGK